MHSQWNISCGLPCLELMVTTFHSTIITLQLGQVDPSDMLISFVIHIH